jgi:diaminohydroxyphosphoribosylaminopyrimidine deaminase/5-amino-6-(5-phosphoribosylamino)uracil reductase
MMEHEAMDRALALALHGWGRVAPNPLVGVVLLREGGVVGEGAHLEFGKPHAEPTALALAGEAARGSTCVINLEPCAHHGKTPPCADALIAAGVARVVMSVRDPHREAGGGAEKLREAGVEVEIGLREREAAALNAAFLWSQVRHERPFVALKVATSLDGFLADTEGRSQWISGPEAREYVHWLRAGFDAVGAGRGTVEKDDAQLTVRGPVAPRVVPTRVVFSRSGQISRDRLVVRTASSVPTVVFTSPERRGPVETELAGTAVTVLGVDGLAAALQELRYREIRSVLVEGGSGVAKALLEEDLVDRIYWIQAPLLLGDGVSAFGRRPARALGDAARWTVTERGALGHDTLLMVDRKLCLPGS